MPKPPTTIDPTAKKYWSEKLGKLKQGNVAPADVLQKEQRRFFTRNDDGHLLANDAAAAQILIEQAIIALEACGFDSDERNLLRSWLESSAPKRQSGQPPVSMIDKLAIHYLYARMTGQQEDEIGPLTEILTPEFPHDTSIHMQAASDLVPNDIDDEKRHRLNTVQAKKLLREALDISPNKLREILKSGTPRQKNPAE